MTKRRRRSTWIAGAIVVAASLGGAAAAAVSEATAPSGPVVHCKRGTTAATTAGRHVCLAAGQTCRKAADKQYHRYRFHCHLGKLTRFKPNPPAPLPLPPPPPLPGVKLDVGGYRLYLHCTGSGAPAVVFEGGTGTADATRPAPQSANIRAALSSGTRVCAYDRAGLGASEARPAGTAPTGRRYADELHALLAGAGVPGPYVLVGASHGGYITMSYALHYPGETAGLVFVDSVAACTCVVPEVEPGQFELASVSFGARPVVVLRATETDGRDLASRSTNSILIDSDSTHFVAQERPQLVVEATRLVVAVVRSGSPLPPCAETPLPAAGGRCE
jgi:hypothetical protein